MKHIIVSLVTLTVIAAGCGVAYAHLEAQLLVSPGLTPSSPFYFLDRLGEFVEEFLTFSPEGKARLQVEFAAERVAEVKLTLETRGASSRALETALDRLQDNVLRATDILAEEKSEGKDVDDLAAEIKEDFEEQEDLLEEIFEERKEILEVREEELKKKIEELTEDEEVSELLDELNELAEELEVLEKPDLAEFDGDDLDLDEDLEEELEDIEELEKEAEETYKRNPKIC